MAILDSVFEFSDAQAVSQSSAGVLQSTDVVDLGATHEDAWGTTSSTHRMGGESEKLTLVVSVAGAPAGGTTTVQAYHHTAATSIASGTAVGESVAIATATAANTMYRIPLPNAAYDRYLGLTYTASGGAVTTGTLNAYLVTGSGTLHD